MLWPLAQPHLFTGYRRPPKAFLLVGPPGTGKTMLVEKVCGSRFRMSSASMMKLLQSADGGRGRDGLAGSHPELGAIQMERRVREDNQIRFQCRQLHAALGRLHREPDFLPRHESPCKHFLRAPHRMKWTR